MRAQLEIPETQNLKLEPIGIAKPSTPHRLTGTGPGFAHQDTVGLVFAFHPYGPDTLLGVCARPKPTPNKLLASGAPRSHTPIEPPPLLPSIQLGAQLTP
jgi:hypothetical protein